MRAQRLQGGISTVLLFLLGAGVTGCSVGATTKVNTFESTTESEGGSQKQDAAPKETAKQRHAAAALSDLEAALLAAGANATQIEPILASARSGAKALDDSPEGEGSEPPYMLLMLMRGAISALDGIETLELKFAFVKVVVKSVIGYYESHSAELSSPERAQVYRLFVSDVLETVKKMFSPDLVQSASVEALDVLKSGVQAAGGDVALFEKAAADLKEKL